MSILVDGLSGRLGAPHFAEAREAAGLPGELDLHALRHSYISHLVEFDYPDAVRAAAGGALVGVDDGGLHELSGIASDGRESAGRHVRAVLFWAFEGSRRGCLIW